MRIAASMVVVALAVGFAVDRYEAKAAGAQEAGKVTFYRGKVFRATSDKGPWLRLKRNKPFFRGDLIRTEAGSRVELKFVDRSIVRLGAKTTLELHEAFFAKRASKKVSATVKAGRAWANVNKFVGGANAFDLRSDNAVAGVRGTIFDLFRRDDGATEVSVFDGIVAVDNSPYLQAMKAREKNAKPAHRRTGRAPIAFGNRKEVELGIKAISRQQWEQMVGKFQRITIAANGEKSDVAKFSNDQLMASADGDWAKWNQERDRTSGVEH